jgi:signal transduction histidine kinase/CheY-like chemotaxis protein
MKIIKGALSRGGAVLGLVLVWCGASLALAAAAKDEPVLFVHEILRERDANRVPLATNKIVVLRGVLTSTPWHGTNTSIVHFQDETGGLLLVGRNVQTFANLAAGDRVWVRGKVSHYRGMDQVVVDRIRLENSGSVPKPRDVWTTDLLDENFAGQLVRIEGEITATRRAGEPVFVLRDERGEIPLLISPAFLTWHGGTLNFALWKGGRASVIGIAGQDKAGPPFDSGYALIPRTPEDFQFVPPPPPPPSRVSLYIALGAAGFLAVLAYYFWERHRLSERRAKEVSQLLHQIERSEAEVKKQAAFAQFNPNPVLELFADGRITYSNDAARDLAELFGKSSVEELLPPNVREIVQECSDTRRARLEVEVKIGARTVSWSFFPIHEITSVHAYGYDVTEQLNLETHLRQVQKLDSIGQLAAGIAHDFNNLLSVIQGYAGIAKMRNDLSPKISEALGEISLAAERATNLTRQLLTFSRRHAMERRPLNLNDLVSNVSKMLRRLLGDGVSLKFQSATEDAWVMGDPGMIEQVVVNLAVNARDAMSNGGELCVSVSRAQLSTMDAQQRVEAREGEFVCLCVSDTGSGMSEATLKRIFEPFFTTKEPGKGTGLGLATVHGIVKQHKGWVEVSTQEGKGTTFRVYLPSTARRGPESTRVIHLPITGGTETILVVEDDAAVRKLARTVLQEYGYVVHDAASAEEALRLWEQHGSQIQLLLTDISLPDGETGWKLAEQLRAKNPALKVVYSSGSSVESMDAGATLLWKPYEAQALVCAVRDALDHVPISNSAREPTAAERALLD